MQGNTNSVKEQHYSKIANGHILAHLQLSGNNRERINISASNREVLYFRKMAG